MVANLKSSLGAKSTGQPNITQHPDFERVYNSYRIMRDCYDGEETIKRGGQIYLPATQSQILDGVDTDGSVGNKAYKAYRDRANFPDFLSDAIEIAIGMMHKKEAVINLPSEMEYLREMATTEGDSLQTLLMKIHEEQLLMGRTGLFVDIEDYASVNNMPYLVQHRADCIPNWYQDPILELVVLDESAPQLREGTISWFSELEYRVLTLDRSGSEPVYKQSIHKGAYTYREEDMITPMYKGRTLDQIPFVFINIKDTTARVSRSPLQGLARLCLSIYRSDADYRQNLHMQGQDTLVVIGGNVEQEGDAGVRVGAGALLDIEHGGDAKYVGVGSAGLSEQRLAIQTDMDRARSKTVQLQGSLTSRDSESAGSRRMRLQSETANLTQIAEIGALGLEDALKKIAKWIGADQSQVSVTANTEFSDMHFDGQNLVQIITGKRLGAPISWESIHAFMQEKGLTSLAYAEELMKIGDEVDLVPEIGNVDGVDSQLIVGRRRSDNTGDPAPSPLDNLTEE